MAYDTLGNWLCNILLYKSNFYLYRSFRTRIGVVSCLKFFGKVSLFNHI